MATGSETSEKRMTPTGLNTEHYTALLVVGSVILLYLIGKGITGLNVPLTNVRVGA